MSLSKQQKLKAYQITHLYYETECNDTRLLHGYFIDNPRQMVLCKCQIMMVDEKRTMQFEVGSASDGHIARWSHNKIIP